ncbi:MULTISPECIES: hypothetical protein [unclassified Spirosoma]|uniref:hypothetical protein n=1 Tax=unclassified Spirosoma TaxID=2621999 RepID=UPI00095F8F8E|nr:MULTISPECIES: hypothetical protein [unclassified Spirosoma]MBN8820775.1 hypothetical protein [Spirosoma sp.]OJW76367.1 MAG: hypothetical protein BGO59_22875 [Spirosoma sp. 48-14]
MDFISHAQKIELDLIRGDWAIKREVIYKAKLSEYESKSQRQAQDLEKCQQANGKLSTELTGTKQQLGEQTLKTRQAKLEVWAMRLAVTLYVAGKIKGIVP